MQQSSTEFPAPFRALLDRITEAATCEDFVLATSRAKEAIAWGRENGDQEAIDRALCNQIGFSILCFTPSKDAAATLQRILMRSSRIGTSFAAANHLSLLYDHRRLYEKSLFYARLALKHAQQAGDPTWTLKAWNRIGNVQIVQSRFADAYGTYQRILALLEPSQKTERAVSDANIGYCLLMLEEHRAGLRKLMESRRLIRRLGLPGFEARIGIRLSICYAYIELGRFDLAHRHGTAALEQGEAIEDPELTEKALYLLGEVAKKAGDDDLAFELFDRLEATFHPEQAGLADLLMAVESHKLVNLRA